MAVAFQIFSTYSLSGTSTLSPLARLHSPPKPYARRLCRLLANQSFVPAGRIATSGRSPPGRESDVASRRSSANAGRERCSSSLKKRRSTAAKIAQKGAPFSFWRAISTCGYAVFATKSFGEPSKC